MVIDTDVSSFITKDEIDSKIDGAIAAYLAGIKVDDELVKTINYAK